MCVGWLIPGGCKLLVFAWSVCEANKQHKNKNVAVEAEEMDSGTPAVMFMGALIASILIWKTIQYTLEVDKEKI